MLYHPICFVLIDAFCVNLRIVAKYSLWRSLVTTRNLCIHFFRYKELVYFYADTFWQSWVQHMYVSATMKHFRLPWLLECTYVLSPWRFHRYNIQLFYDNFWKNSLILTLYYYSLCLSPQIVLLKTWYPTLELSNPKDQSHRPLYRAHLKAYQGLYGLTRKNWCREDSNTWLWEKHTSRSYTYTIISKMNLFQTYDLKKRVQRR